MELLRVKTLVHVDKWYPWLSSMLKTKLVRYVDGQRETYTEHLYTRPEGDPGGFFAAGFLDDVLRGAKARGIETKYVDLREYPPDAYGCHPEALEVNLRFKQDEALKAISEHDKGIIKCSTGFGKSFIIKCLTIMYPKARFVICTEAAAVVQSLYEALVAVHGKAQVGLIKGGTHEEEEYKRIQVSTTRSILRSQIDKAEFLLFDEVHNCGDNEITEVLMNHVDHARMFGFTASLWRGDKAEDLIKGLFGEVIVDVSYQEAAEHNMVVPIKALMVPCKTKEKQVTDSMMLDKRFNYILNKGRNELIASVAREIPAEEQVLIMVSTFEHAVRLHQLLPEFTVCHGGNGVKVRRNRPWVDVNAPEAVTVVNKAKGSVHVFVRCVNGLGTISFEECNLVKEVTKDFVPDIVPNKVDRLYKVNDIEIVSQSFPEAPVRYVQIERTGSVISTAKMFSDYLQIDGSVCGAPQTVDRNIMGLDMAQYRMSAKTITKIRREFEEGTLKKLIATNIFSEGVNFIHLKYLIRADGETSKISNTQIPGRLSRLCEGKDCAFLIDFIDHFSPWAYQRSIARFNNYRENGWVDGKLPPRETKE